MPESARSDERKLPGIELHCHLDGSLPLETVRKITGKQDIREEDLRADARCRNLREYLTRFDLPLEGMQTREGLETAAEDFLRSLAGDGVRYVEVRFAPMLSGKRGLDCRQVLESVLTGLSRGQKAVGIRWQVIVCAMRHQDPETNLAMMRCAREFLGQGVCALDLAGDEAAYPAREFRPLFAQAEKMDFPFTIHAGECGSLENVREAVEMGARRLGHGIALRGDAGLQQRIRDLGIGIEMCPTSNFQTRAAGYGDYPLEEFLRAGLLVSVNTDNRTVSGTTLTEELDLAVSLSGGLASRRLFLENAARTAFLSQEKREELLRDLEIS